MHRRDAVNRVSPPTPNMIRWRDAVNRVSTAAKLNDRSVTVRTYGLVLVRHSLPVTLFQNRYRVESARLLSWDYSSRGWYLVTICTQNKKCTLAFAHGREFRLTPAGSIAETQLRAIPSHYSNVSIDKFVVMPNHIHTIIVIDGKNSFSPELVVYSLPGNPTLPAKRAPSLSTIVGSYKAGVSRVCRRQGILDLQWQARFHDHLLRSNASVNGARDYIESNPARWFEDAENAGVVVGPGDAASRVSTK